MMSSGSGEIGRGGGRASELNDDYPVEAFSPGTPKSPAVGRSIVIGATHPLPEDPSSVGPSLPASPMPPRRVGDVGSGDSPTDGLPVRALNFDDAVEDGTADGCGGGRPARGSLPSSEGRAEAGSVSGGRVVASWDGKVDSYLQGSLFDADESKRLFAKLTSGSTGSHEAAETPPRRDQAADATATLVSPGDIRSRLVSDEGEGRELFGQPGEVARATHLPASSAGSSALIASAGGAAPGDLAAAVGTNTAATSNAPPHRASAVDGARVPASSLASPDFDVTLAEERFPAFFLLQDFRVKDQANAASSASAATPTSERTHGNVSVLRITVGPVNGFVDTHNLQLAVHLFSSMFQRTRLDASGGGGGDDDGSRNKKRGPDVRRSAPADGDSGEAAVHGGSFETGEGAGHMDAAAGVDNIDALEAAVKALPQRKVHVTVKAAHLMVCATAPGTSMSDRCGEVGRPPLVRCVCATSRRVRRRGRQLVQGEDGHGFDDDDSDDDEDDGQDDDGGDNGDQGPSGGDEGTGGDNGGSLFGVRRHFVDRPRHALSMPVLDLHIGSVDLVQSKLGWHGRSAAVSRMRKFTQVDGEPGTDRDRRDVLARFIALSSAFDDTIAFEASTVKANIKVLSSRAVLGLTAAHFPTLFNAPDIVADTAGYCPDMQHVVSMPLVSVVVSSNGLAEGQSRRRPGTDRQVSQAQSHEWLQAVPRFT